MIASIKKRTQIGERRHFIQIQSQSTQADAYGGEVAVWFIVRECYAKISTASSKEMYLAGQFTEQISHIVNICWRDVEIAAGMRVVFGKRTFVIQGPENVDERNEEINLMCLELGGAVT